MDWPSKIRLGAEVLRYKITRQSRPVTVTWLITGRCNQLCGYCKWKDLRSSDELDTGQVKGLLRQMKRAGVRLVAFTGGEPLLRRDMGEIVREVKAHGMVCKLNTNGRRVERFLDDLRPLDLLQISLDGPPDVHDLYRGEGATASAVRAVELARGAGIPLLLTTCLTRQNVARMDEVLDFGLQLGVGMRFQVLATETLDPEEAAHMVPDRHALGEVLSYLLDLKARRDPRAAAIASISAELRYYLQQVQGHAPQCPAALVTCTLLPDGQMLFCSKARAHGTHDAVALGFEEAFRRVEVPPCGICTCVGKLRLAQVFELNPAMIWEIVKL